MIRISIEMEAEDLLRLLSAPKLEEVQVLLSSIARAPQMPSLPPPALPARVEPMAALSPREREVVVAVVKSRGGKAIVAAEALGISSHTLRNHLTTIYSKLGVQGRIGLYTWAVQHGVTTPDSGGARHREVRTH